MTAIDRAVTALRIAADRLEDLPPETDVLRRGGVLEEIFGVSGLTPSFLRRDADRLEEIQIAARATLEIEEPGS